MSLAAFKYPRAPTACPCPPQKTSNTSSSIKMSKYSQEIDYICYEEEEEDDLCISIEGFHGSEQPGFHKETVRSPMLKEKQISVDPISLKQSTRHEGPPLLPLIVTSFTSTAGPVLYPPPLPPSKHKSVSASLPSSATASPRSSGVVPQTKNAKKGRSQAIQAASLGLSRFASESLLLRSKSCGEGRASSPSDEFDLFSGKLPSPPKHDVEEDDGYYREYKRDDHVGGIGKKVISRVDKRDSTEEQEDGYYQEYKRDISGKKVRDTNTNTGRYKDEIDIFKCGKCLFLPAFGKGKPVRARKLEEAGDHQPVVVVEEEVRNVISRSVSLEKFECGSWTSSAIMNEDDNDDRESMHHLYFDLPLELIQNCGNDANSPVTTAFLFDSDRSGALNNNNNNNNSSSSRTETRNPRESSRYVRISSTGSSSSSCITPRLRKARDDFNAFLQAQNA